MRTAAKPTIPCAAMASSHCRQGLLGLEGLRRGYDMQARNIQGAAGEHRAVPQRCAAHAGGPACHPRLPDQRRVYRCAHQSADPRSALHHRPHRPAIPGGNSFHYISTTWGHLNSAPIDLRPESRICSHADPSVRDSNSSAMSIFSKRSASVSLWPKVKKSTLPVTPFLIFGANEKSSCFLCENSCSFLIFIYFNCYLFKFLSIHPCICLSILK